MGWSWLQILFQGANVVRAMVSCSELKVGVSLLPLLWGDPLP